MVSLSNAYTRKWIPSDSSGATTTAAFTPAVGDVIVVKTVTENYTVVPNAPTGTNLSFGTAKVSRTTTLTSQAIWAATVTTSASTTVTHGAATAQGARSSTVEWWTSVALDATPVTCSADNSTQSAPSTTISTEAANSVVTWVCGDWHAVAGTITYRENSGVPVETLHDQDTAGVNYCGYHVYQPAASQGSQTLGMTSPSTQQWSIIGLELLNSGGTNYTRNPADDSAGLTDSIVIELSKVVTDNEGGTDWVTGLPEPPWTYTCSVVIG